MHVKGVSYRETTVCLRYWNVPDYGRRLLDRVDWPHSVGALRTDLTTEVISSTPSTMCFGAVLVTRHTFDGINRFREESSGLHGREMTTLRNGACV